jgi:hypothetical protein
MTDQQKSGQWQGEYIDNDNTKWLWTCAKPKVTPDEPSGDDNRPG